jgi:hypothetical protein
MSVAQHDVEQADMAQQHTGRRPGGRTGSGANPVVSTHQPSVRGQAASPTPEPAAPRFWRIGLLLLAGVLVLLLGAFLLDRQLRPRVGVEPLPASNATAPPGVATAARTQAPGSQPGAGTTTGPQATAGTGTPSPATGASSPVASSPASLQREIETAYLRFWEVRAEALFIPDASRLPEVMAGPALDREREQIDQLRARGQAAKLVVEHHIALRSAGPTTAVVYDEYVNKSYLVDAQTKEPVGTPGPGGIAKVSYVLEKIDGSWKVVDGVVYE